MIHSKDFHNIEMILEKLHTTSQCAKKCATASEETMIGVNDRHLWND